MRKFGRQVWFSFPIQLLLLHLRSNLLLLSLWVFLLLLVSGRVGHRLGLQYLFLDPEYLGNVNFLSFYLVGLALGGFFMSWNLTTYLLTAHHFPFLASLSRPFTKFSINNALLPAFFGISYMALLAHFQYSFQYLSFGKVAWLIFALLLGAFSLVIGYT
ncbi:MAG: patatin-like phospholipase family protein, partial [Lewinella sp.]|nr:patatin-like phospholipase family protein [Lewinella sp.]